MCLDLSDIRDVGTAQESKQQSTHKDGQPVWGRDIQQQDVSKPCRSYSPKGTCRLMLVVITLLLLKVKYEECLINSLAERVKKDTQPPSVLLTYEPLHRCLWGLTDPHL